MYVCRIFHRDQPFEQIDARLLSEGRLTVGRDPSADWVLEDPEGVLSRIHFTLELAENRLLLTDKSTNGTFMGNGDRAPKDLGVPLVQRDTVRFGLLSLLVEKCDKASAELNLMPDLSRTQVASEWLDGPAPRARHLDESLIEAFCEGAQLDCSALSGEDPAELMRRIGTVYRHTILGLAALMGDRSKFKASFDLDHTTIASAANNPFKWAPTRKLGLTLLTLNDPSFLKDADAVHACFEDLAHHIAGLIRGGNAALDHALATLSPEAIDAEVDQQKFSLKSRANLSRDVLSKRHAQLKDANGLRIKQAFSAAYNDKPVTSVSSDK